MTENKKPVAVITGSNGFVGSHLADFLLEKGMHVKCIVRKSSNLQWLKDKPFEFCYCGLTDIAALREAFADANYIFHIAGTVKARTDADFVYGNVEMTRNVLEAALGINSIEKIVITSSIAACGPAPKDGIIKESDPCRPIDPYGRSKVLQEEMAQKYMERLPITIVRPPVVYGERDAEIFQYFQAVNRRIRPLVGVFGEKQLSMVYVSNLVEGLYLCAIKPQAKGQTYFFTDSHDYNWAQIGKVAAKHLGKKTMAIRIPHFLIYTVAGINHLWGKITRKAMMLNLHKAKQMVAPSWMCSSQKAKEELGYVPKVELEEGFKRSVDWYRAQKWI